MHPGDLKPTDLKNILMKTSIVGKENYEKGIFWDTNYNITAKK